MIFALIFYSKHIKMSIINNKKPERHVFFTHRSGVSVSLVSVAGNRLGCLPRHSGNVTLPTDTDKEELLLFLLLLFGYQFNNAHLGSVASAGTLLDDACVTAVYALILGGDLVKELL